MSLNASVVSRSHRYADVLWWASPWTLVFLLFHRHLSDSLQSSLVSLLIPFRVHPPLLTPLTLSATFLTLPQTTDIQLPHITFLSFFFNIWKIPPCFSLSALLHTAYSGSHLQTTLAVLPLLPRARIMLQLSSSHWRCVLWFELHQSSGMFGIWTSGLDPSQCLVSASRSWQKLFAAEAARSTRCKWPGIKETLAF